MPSSSIYKGYEVPTVSGDSGTWGSSTTGLNATIALIDTNLGGYAAVSLSNANVTLSSTQDRMAILRLTGTLTGNIVITSSCQGFKFCENLTTGSYTVSIQNSVGSTVAIPQGYSSLVIFDSTNGARLGVSTPVINAAYIAALSAQINASILAYTQQSVTASSSSLSINCALGMAVDLTLNASVTSVAVTNWPTAGTMGRLTINVTSGGSYTMTGWPGTTYWPGGSAPTITASGQDTLVLVSTNGGTVFRGYTAGQALA